ncbi:MAG TPA: UDP-glucose/GDP-mannose dehydrogenase family protein [Candidatus Angelobacter sp.]|nr:UDP-glucose/GDP-mannose dehydrogenase family protein [Candidatus Angelobacter sp.]
MSAGERSGAHSQGIAVVGAGYVGLTTGVALASEGHRVVLVETDPTRLARLARGDAPIYEMGVAELLRSALDAGVLTVTGRIEMALETCRVVVVAVGTPSLPDGSADLGALNTVVSQVRMHGTPGTVMVIKSTVPPGTAARLQHTLDGKPFRIPVVSCPEFLREGTALEDLATAPRVVVGGDDDEAVAKVAGIFAVPGAQLVLTDSTSAELVKYGSNAFLATKISFINEIANVCELLGGDVDQVARGMGLDPRIGRSFLNAGLGFGGSCFPKDVRALDALVGRSGYSFWMLKTAIEVNERQRTRFVHKIREAIGNPMEGRRVALLGLAFKPGTDDVRQAPSLDIAERLLELGVEVVAHDPAAMAAVHPLLPRVTMAATPYHAVRDADAVALVTEWPEYAELDWARVRVLMRRPAVVDGRNVLDAAMLAAEGFNYHSMGRRAVVTQWARRAVDMAVA